MKARRETKNDLYYFVNNRTNVKIPGPQIPWFWALLVTPLYFLYWRAWKHAFISVLLYITTFGLVGIAYSIFARRVLENTYLKKGWRIVNLDENQRTWVKRDSPVLPWLIFLSLTYIVIRTGWGKISPYLFQTYFIPLKYVKERAIGISDSIELSILSFFIDVTPYFIPSKWYDLQLIPQVIEGTFLSLLAVPIFIFMEERSLQQKFPL